MIEQNNKHSFSLDYSKPYLGLKGSLEYIKKEVLQELDQKIEKTLKHLDVVIKDQSAKRAKCSCRN